MNIQLILTILLVVSVLINILFFWYTRNILAKLLFVSENIGDLMEMANRFVDHVDSIHQMEMFYGDETLGFLVQHARDLAEQFEMFEQIFTLTEEGDEEFDDENSTTETQETTEK